MYNDAVSLPPVLVPVMVYKAPVAVASGVPERTHVELNDRPEGSDGELLHEVIAPPPDAWVGVSGFMV